MPHLKLASRAKWRIGGMMIAGTFGGAVLGAATWFGTSFIAPRAVVWPWVTGAVAAACLVASIFLYGLRSEREEAKLAYFRTLRMRKRARGKHRLFYRELWLAGAQSLFHGTTACLLSWGPRRTAYRECLG